MNNAQRELENNVFTKWYTELIKAYRVHEEMTKGRVISVSTAQKELEVMTIKELERIFNI